MMNDVTTLEAILSPVVWDLFQSHDKGAMVDWLCATIAEFLETTDSWCRSFASDARAVAQSTTIEQLEDLQSSILQRASTSDVDLDTAVFNLCRAKLALTKGKMSTYNSHVLRAATILDELPYFRVRGFLIARRRLAEYQKIWGGFAVETVILNTGQIRRETEGRV
jgi:hypothetical protein